MTTEHDPRLLLRVLRWLGTEQGIRFHEPAVLHPVAVELPTQLAAIAVRSGIRCRTVRLGARWWTTDCGPLLGLQPRIDPQNPDRIHWHPIGLRPKPGGGYEAYDPETDAVAPLTDADAAPIADRATQFYRPLPESPLRLRDLPARVLKPFRRELGQFLFALVFVLLPAILLPRLTQTILDEAVPDANRRMLLELGGGIVAVMLGQLIGTLVQGFVFLRVRSAGTLAVQTAIWDRLLRLPLRFFRRYPSGELLNRAMLMEEFAESLGESLYRGFFGAVTALLYLLILIPLAPSLAILAWGLSLIAASVTVGIGLLMVRTTLRAGRVDGRVYGWLVQLLRGLFVLRTAAAEERAHGRWADRYAESLALAVQMRRWEDWKQMFHLVFPALAMMLLYLQVVGISEDPTTDTRITTGSFLAFVTAFGFVLSGVQSASTAILEWFDGWSRLRLLEPILLESPHPPSSRPETPWSQLADPGELRGRVQVDAVGFRYSPQGPLVLQDVQFAVEPGSFTAIVGPSGCGKSTLLRLLLGLEAPTQGQIRWDGQPLGELNPVRLRQQCGVVLQSAEMLSGTLLDNLLMGRPIPEDAIEIALRDAQLLDDVQAMPMNIHTMINDGGRNLSGGQRQRLLIARALAGMPRVLLFDEATSALDQQTQTQIIQALASRAITRIVVAHRLSTIEAADQILVLDSGRIIQQGRFAELAAQPGLFQDLLARQQLRQESS
ncbi:ATP-binding cassette domain-containing protein [Tuwongella immobilis]|uniref:ABC transporter domain-containing protein n=1 Tax=Tuwongella immobilis TaxID=692036 RepID=A0A6C2YV74_9BACT|nr:ATP-binding cassette domain-containing protein [Tuwongella immobilis]VIP05510.1 abc transporter atp-binding protein : ABC-type bacteriocin/lantibiotic exporter OS=Moorea producens 3L GN=LYNGBM3L_32220 PE=3 SV=1: ABC_tran [Tuwongella immobilis]VTS08376.1 abc transporter atp-binding protein : ABC-type bacteriocin/lantibiotic exporter OS=Moorea producens 3L GN=LYNGBM3L_32220 PE=3 SV=1: ABC_tran [Tuwongella immobilis]